jgi:hypothetical protein
MLHAFFKQLSAGGNIYAGRTLWLRAESLSLSNGASVSTWANEGSAGGTFTAPATAPVYNTNQVNSKPAVTFQAPAAMITTKTVADILGSGQAWAFVIAARGIGDETSASPGAPWLNSVGSNTLNIGVITRSIFPTVSGVNYNGGTYASNDPFVFGHSNAASGSHHILDSMASANANLGTLSGIASAALRIGINQTSQQFGFMQILEMMAFNKFKSAAELAAVSASLRSKYAIS